jgi:uncharacterized protein (DUF952 family)
MTIYKVVPKQMWLDATQNGAFAGSPADLADGFIHFSTAEQLRETVARHFAGVEDLLLIAFEAAALGGALKWEPSRGGALFPHLYAPLRVDLAVSITPMPLDQDGTPIVPL